MKTKYLFLLAACLLIPVIALCVYLVSYAHVYSNNDETHVILGHVERAAHIYRATYGYPPESLKDVSDFIAKDKSRYRGVRVSANGTFVDSWGNGVFYELSPDSISATLRSFGADGKDNNGQGDDIQILYKYMKSFEQKPQPPENTPNEQVPPQKSKTEGKPQ